MQAVAKFYIVVIILSWISISWLQNYDLLPDLKGIECFWGRCRFTKTGILNCPDFRKRLHK